MDNLPPSNPYMDQLSTMVKKQVAGQAIDSNFNLMRKETEGSEIAIIKGLGHKEHIKEIWMLINGYDYNYYDDKWEKVSEPIMNPEGIRNLMTILNIALRMDFSNIEPEDIPKIVLHFFKNNFPQFIVYEKEFGLNPMNNNIVSTACFFAPYISARNAKGAGHRNAVRGTFSEDVLAKLGTESTEKKGLLARWFGRKK